MAAKSDDKFELHHKEVDGKHTLIITPSVTNEGYPPKEVEITEGQWNDMKYHFAMGIHTKTGDEKLIYVH
jgi:hypothetical protein